MPGESRVKAPSWLDEVGDGAHANAAVDVHRVVDEALSEVVDAPRLRHSQRRALRHPESASVWRERLLSRADQRAHPAQSDVLEGLGEDLPLGLDAVLCARRNRVLTKEAVSQFLRRAPEVRERRGGRPHFCQRGHRGYGDVPDQGEAVGEVPAEVVGVLMANLLEVPVDEGHLEA